MRTRCYQKGLRLTLRLFILSLLLISNGMVAQAKWTPPAKPPPTRGKIVRVDTANLSVTIQFSIKGSSHTYPLVPQCTIELSGNEAKLKDIKPGLFIRSMRLDSGAPTSLEDLDVVGVDGH